MTENLEPMNPDSEAIYDEQISPLMTQIIAICKKYHIPMLASFQYGADNDFCSTQLVFAGMSKVLWQAMLTIYPQ